MMKQTSRTLFPASLAILMLAATTYGQGQRGATGTPQGGPPAVAGRGGAEAAPTPPKPLIANAKPVRSCESLTMVALPNTTIESAVIDPNNPGVCRVTAFTTHPPTGDRVRIWVGIPTSNWNGRFLGTGGGGFVGGSPQGINQPVALGYAAGATDTGHEGGSGSFALDANGQPELAAHS
jgi:feruloyl esterase